MLPVSEVRHTVKSVATSFRNTRSFPPGPNGKSSSTLSKTGLFINGVVSNTAMIAIIQPLFTLKTFRMSGLGNPPLSHLYKGMIANSASGGPAEGLAFLCQDVIFKSFHLRGPKPSVEISNFFASFIAGTAGAPINAACERLMIQRQIYGTKIGHILREDCVKGCFVKRVFHGTMPTAGRDAIFNVGVFALNDWTSKKLEKQISKESLRTCISSTVSGAIAGFASTPLDVVKTTMQSDMKVTLKSFCQTAKQIVEENGVKELFRGGGVRSVLIAVATCAITLAKGIFPIYLPDFLHQNSESNSKR